MVKYKSKHGYEGLLIVIEGTDGSGKSTQIGRLKRWIEDQPEFARYINKYWIRPLESERPDNAKAVEGGCYW